MKQILIDIVQLLLFVFIAWGLDSRFTRAIQTSFQQAVAMVLFSKIVRMDIDEAILILVKSWEPTHAHITNRDAKVVERLWELGRNARVIEAELRRKLTDPQDISVAERRAVDTLFKDKASAVSVNTKPSRETLREWFDAMLAVEPHDDLRPPTVFLLRHSGAFDIHQVHEHKLEPNESNAQFLSTKFDLLARDHVRHTKGPQTFHVIATSDIGGLWGSKFFTIEGGDDAVGEVQCVHSA
jgi:hypothetical protein